MLSYAEVLHASVTVRLNSDSKTSLPRVTKYNKISKCRYPRSAEKQTRPIKYPITKYPHNGVTKYPQNPKTHTKNLTEILDFERQPKTLPWQSPPLKTSQTPQANGSSSPSKHKKTIAKRVFFPC